MLYKISLDNGFSGEHFGLSFANGEAHTEDAFLASRLRGKGYNVTAAAGAADKMVSDQGEASEAPPFAEAGELTQSDLDKMNIAQLKAFAEENGIDLGSAKLKAEIIAAIVAAMFYVETPETE